jgi:hypothetical protein
MERCDLTAKSIGKVLDTISSGVLIRRSEREISQFA